MASSIWSDNTDESSNSGSSSTSSYKPSSSSSKYNSNHSHNSYDDGYDDVYFDNDYDQKRYDSDDDYATGGGNAGCASVVLLILIVGTVEVFNQFLAILIAIIGLIFIVKH